uniref:Tyrosinase copper-binding domain-containing protein n=1 Tax=Timema cristinae TaxID=61476 RepID=A0A7R9D2W3_TIMCR|nr:unnamed protein product [Timema cristinae]
MRWVLALVCATLCHLAAAKSTRGEVPADKDFLIKQKEILRLFNKVHEPNRFKEQVEIGKIYEPSNNLNRYKNPVPVKKLVRLCTNNSLLPRGKIFTLFNDKHRNEMVLLFESFLFSQDWETFYKTACWARDRINEVYLRADGGSSPQRRHQGGSLTSFLRDIHAAYKAKMRQEPAVVRMNFTVFCFCPPLFAWLPALAVKTASLYGELGPLVDCILPDALESEMSANHFSLPTSVLPFRSPAAKKFFLAVSVFRSWAVNGTKGLLYTALNIISLHGCCTSVVPFTVDGVSMFPSWDSSAMVSSSSSSSVTSTSDPARLFKSIVSTSLVAKSKTSITQLTGLMKVRSGFESQQGVVKVSFPQSLPSLFMLTQDVSSLVRFDLERLSNDLPFVKPLGWNQKIVDGFYPQTTYRVGGEFPARPDNFEFQDLQNIKIKDLMDYDRRIREAIHQQAVYTVNGDYYSLNDSTGINTLGQIMEPSCGSKHREYYGALHNYGHILLGQITDPKGKFDMPPGVMEHFETATRDPAFFRLHKHIDNLFKLHKDLLPPYSRDESSEREKCASLEFPGVKIQDLSVDELTTYFEDFDIDLLNALDDTVDLDDVNIKARVRRLNHKPFAFHFTVESDKENLVAVRVFMGPKYDWFGQEIPLDEKRSYMVEIDKFVTKVNAGQTMFHRKSSESSVTIPDRETTKTLVAKVENAINGRASLTVNKVTHANYSLSPRLTATSGHDDVRHCGYPDRLLLPKGKKGGLPFTLYAILTDYNKEKVNDLPYDYEYGGSISYCGTINHKYPDSKPMGFPFDRVINQDKFYYPNMFYKDVTITFKEDN